MERTNRAADNVELRWSDDVQRDFWETVIHPLDRNSKQYAQSLRDLDHELARAIRLLD